jgi:N-acetylglucosamine malate deacetylase 1
MSFKNLKNKKISETIKDFKPNEIFVPHPSDSHSDHQTVFKAVSSCTKTFRYPYIKKILCYETLSETGYGLKIKNGTKSFEPNYYVDISKFMKKKLKLLEFIQMSSKSILSLEV